MNENNPNSKKLFIIELSEFNVELLTQAAQLYPLPHLAKILQFKKSNYKTNDRYNSGYLTPAIQWNAIHAGFSSRKIPSDPKFCWQILEEHQITTALWGVQNAQTVYEPITHSPGYLERFKKNRALLKRAFKLGCSLHVLKEIIRFSVKKPKNIAPLARYLSWLDFMSALLFSKFKQKNLPECSILFLGSLAHCQYYHWEGNEKQLSPELKYNVEIIDKILGQLMNDFPEESFIIHNALSQIKIPKTGDRTGQYVPLGMIYSQTIHFPNHIFNYEFNQYVYHHFLPNHYRLKSEYIEDEASILETSPSENA